MDVSVNYLSVLVAAVASFLVGGAWYSKTLFAKPWMKSLNLSAGVPDSSMSKTMGGQFVSLLVTAYVLAHFVHYVGAMTVSAGIQLGFWIWLGFVATVLMTGVLFERKNKTWFLITSGYQLLSLVVMAAILAVWK